MSGATAAAIRTPQAGGAISELAQMAAIVDVYDAITSERCYHKGMPAAEALRKMYEWSKFHFNPALVQEFMRCVGIYPVGTLVLLESGRLGVVVEPHETSLLTPKVNVFFHTRQQRYIKPETVDLSRPVGFGGGDKHRASRVGREVAGRTAAVHAGGLNAHAALRRTRRCRWS